MQTRKHTHSNIHHVLIEASSSIRGFILLYFVQVVVQDKFAGLVVVINTRIVTPVEHEMGTAGDSLQLLVNAIRLSQKLPICDQLCMCAIEKTSPVLPFAVSVRGW
jgi:hypothetical protein